MIARNQAEQEPVLEARSVSKRFGNVVALQDVDFDAYPAQITALIGDNGAGKSTLTNILSGVVSPDAGTLRLHGDAVSFSSPREARNAGIETTYQDLALAPDLDIAANLFLAREPLRPGLLGKLDVFDRSAMRSRAQEHLSSFGVRVGSLDQRVDTLSGGQRQAIAVARSVLWGAAVIIMDEPTAALGAAQTELVLDLMCKVRTAGAAVVFISHNLPQVFATADRIAVLRHGRRVGTLDPKTDTIDHAVSLMTGSRN